MRPATSDINAIAPSDFPMYRACKRRAKRPAGTLEIDCLGPAAERTVSALCQSKDRRQRRSTRVFLPHMAGSLSPRAVACRQCVRRRGHRAGSGATCVSRHQDFGAVNARAWSLAIVRNTAFSWLGKNKPKKVVYLNDLSAAEQQELEYEGLQGTRIETPEEIALFKADAEEIQKALAQLSEQFREVIVLREIHSDELS